MSRNPQARTSSGKLKVTITIDEDQCRAVDTIADQLRTSRGSIIRRAVDLFLVENMDLIHTDPRPSFPNEKVA